jgi:ribonuclease Z
MHVTFLGTSAVVPGGGHDTASLIINGTYLVDTGWYAAVKMKSYGFSPMLLETVLLTHCHHDHYIGLPHILFYLCMRRRERPDRPPLKIVGPAEDIGRVVELARQLLQPGRFPDVDYAPELLPLRPGEAYEDDVLRADTCATRHAVPGLCYRFTEKASGATFAVTGDTAYHPPITEHVRGVPLLVHEASYGPSPAPAEDRALHSGAPEAAHIAAQAGAGRLALVHCPEEHQTAALEAARAIFPASFFPEDGQTVTL